MLTLALLAGLWTSTCIQTQVANENQGYARESYQFKVNGEFEFKREWFRDSECKEANGTFSSHGSVILGKKVQNIFTPSAVFEADFHTEAGIDLGVISITEKSLRLGRGMPNSNMRNTMPGLFEYVKK